MGNFHLLEVSGAGAVIRRQQIDLASFSLDELGDRWLPPISEWADDQKRLWELRILVRERSTVSGGEEDLAE